MSADDAYPPRSAFKTGLGCRCPRCGRGRLFTGFLTVTERCEACRLDLTKADSGDGPAVFIILILGAVVIALAFLVERGFMPPLWVHALLWPPLVLGGSLAMLRPLKGLMIALQYKHKASDSGTLDYDA